MVCVGGYVPSPRQDFKEASQLEKKRRGVCFIATLMFGYAFTFQLSEKMLNQLGLYFEAVKENKKIKQI